MKVNQYIKTGNYHMSKGELCQDVIHYSENSDYAVAVVADGATACVRGREGAELACKAVEDFVNCEGSNIFVFAPEKLAYLLIEYVLFYLETFMERYKEGIQEYASTLIAACIEKRTGKSILLNLGDGAVFSLCGAEIKTQLSPKRFCGQPYLTTRKDAYKAVEVNTIELSLGNAVLLCTDGFISALNSDMQNHDRMRQAIREQEFHRLDAELEQVCETDDFAYIVVTRIRK